MNVGCIPKKLMHQASLLGEAIVVSNTKGFILQGFYVSTFKHYKIGNIVQALN